MKSLKGTQENLLVEAQALLDSLVYDTYQIVELLEEQEQLPAML